MKVAKKDFESTAHLLVALAIGRLRFDLWLPWMLARAGVFRLASVDASTPFLEMLAGDGSGMDIAFYAERGLTFDLQTKSDVNLPWTTWQSPTVANSFCELRLDFASDENQFLRARKE